MGNQAAFRVKAPQSYIKIILLILALFYLYISAAPPAFNNNDSPETITACYTLDIQHPPGYPLFAMIGKLFSFVPAGSIAFRMHIMAAFFALLALICVFEISGGNVMAVLLLSLAPVFISQAADAKGGIYMLNIFFLAAIVLLCSKIIMEYKKSHMYLASFLLGLSFANHWPSTIVIVPAVIWMLFLSRRRMNGAGFLTVVFLFVLGLTPYIYLPIRAFAGPEMNYGNPQTPGNFLWVILRLGYGHSWPDHDVLNIFYRQIRYFFTVLFESFSFFALFAAAGIFYLRRDLKMLSIYAAVFLIDFFAVVFFNKTVPESMALIGVFSMPALFAVAILSACGISGLLGKLSGHSGIILTALIYSVVIFFGLSNAAGNNNPKNYIAYDYGLNLLQTMEKGSIYIPEGDSNLYPVYYFQKTQKKRDDIIVIPVNFVGYKWYRENLIKKYGGKFPEITSIRDKNGPDCVSVLLLTAAAKDKYRSYYNKEYASKLNAAQKQLQKGLLIKFVDKDILQPSYVFKLYSYRGLFGRQSSVPGLNEYYDNMVSAWYPASFYNQAQQLQRIGRSNEADALYRTALRLPQAGLAAKSGLFNH